MSVSYELIYRLYAIVTSLYLEGTSVYTLLASLKKITCIYSDYIIIFRPGIKSLYEVVISLRYIVRSLSAMV